MDISEFRQTCRMLVRIKGGKPEEVVLRLAHQDPEGLNARPVGKRVHLKGEWFDSKDVEVVEMLPWLG